MKTDPSKHKKKLTLLDYHRSCRKRLRKPDRYPPQQLFIKLRLYWRPHISGIFRNNRQVVQCNQSHTYNRTTTYCGTLSLSVLHSWFFFILIYITSRPRLERYFSRPLYSSWLHLLRCCSGEDAVHVHRHFQVHLRGYPSTARSGLGTRMWQRSADQYPPDGVWVYSRDNPRMLHHMQILTAMFQVKSLHDGISLLWPLSCGGLFHRR